MKVPYSGRDLWGRLFQDKSINEASFRKAELRSRASCFAALCGEDIGNGIRKCLTTANTRVLVALIVTTVLLGMIMYLTGVGTALEAVCVVFVLTLMATMF